MLNIFYAEPDPDRWLPFDRYPRHALRRLLRGPRQPGGMERYFLNLVAGLERLKEPHRVNAFRHAARHRDEAVGIVGKAHLLRQHDWKNPIVFGPAVYSHPSDDVQVFRDRPIRKILVSCDWLKTMYESAIDVPVAVWPAGIDTDAWAPARGEKDIDVLVYDKVRWEHERYERELIAPILARLRAAGLRVETIRYGFYREEDFRRLLSRSRAMIFLCEHETQGFAYLQTLSAGVPIMAWDRGGPWQDPAYFPHKVVFAPVTSVPYWDARCGRKFKDADDFASTWDAFWQTAIYGAFDPRAYVLENLTLEECARNYCRLMQS